MRVRNGYSRAAARPTNAQKGYEPPLPWFRLYSEIVADPKVQRLSEAMRWRFVGILCLTAQRIVPSSDDDTVAFALRLGAEDAAETKRTLRGAKLIGRDWKPLAWDRRQRISDDAALRKRRQRARVQSHESGLDMSRDMSRDCPVVEGEERERRTEKNRTDQKDAREQTAMQRIQRLNGGNGQTVNGQVLEARTLKSPRTPSSGSRKNGDFERINADVMTMIERGGCSADDSEALAKALHISQAQVTTAIEQLRDRGKLPRPTMRAQA